MRGSKFRCKIGTCARRAWITLLGFTCLGLSLFSYGLLLGAFGFDGLVDFSFELLWLHLDNIIRVNLACCGSIGLGLTRADRVDMAGCHWWLRYFLNLGSACLLDHG
jgi:hypothetical protein